MADSLPPVSPASPGDDEPFPGTSPIENMPMTKKAEDAQPHPVSLSRTPKCAAPFDVTYRGASEAGAAGALSPGHLGFAVRISHPCVDFAAKVGYRSWREAVDAMKGGEVLTGPDPTLGVVFLEKRRFCEGVNQAELRWAVHPDETGRVVIGLPEKIEALQDVWSKVYPPTLGSILRTACNPMAFDLEENATAKAAPDERVSEPQCLAPGQNVGDSRRLVGDLESQARVFLATGNGETMSATAEPEEDMLGHPCDVFAAKSGYASWAAAVSAAKEGQLLKGHGPRVAMTMMAAQAFSEAVAQDGLCWVVGADGRVLVGLAGQVQPERERLGRIIPDLPGLMEREERAERDAGSTVDRLIVVKRDGEPVGAVLADAQPDARPHLASALREARDAMLTMARWVSKSDPAGHSWALRMADRASAALGEQTPSGAPDPESDMALGRVVEFAKAWHWQEKGPTIATVSDSDGVPIKLDFPSLDVVLLSLGASFDPAVVPGLQPGGALHLSDPRPSLRRVANFAAAWRYQRSSQYIALVEDGPEACCVLAVEDLEAVLARPGGAPSAGQSDAAKS